MKGVVIKLGSKFSNIKLLDKNTIEVGASTLIGKFQILQKIIISVVWNSIMYSRFIRRRYNYE